MAIGYIDPDSGTYIYGSDDPRGPLHDVLNKGALAEHNARKADRARLKTLENSEAAALSIQSIVPSSFITLESDYRFQAGFAQVVRRIGSRIEFTLRVEAIGHPLTHGGSIGYLNYQWYPVANTEWQLVAHQSGGGTSAEGVAAVINLNRDILPLNPNGTSTILAFSGFYHMV